MSKFILVVSQSSYECSCELNIPIEAESEHAVKDLFVNRIKESWNEKHGYLESMFTLGKVLGYEDHYFNTHTFLDPKYFDWEQSEMQPPCTIESLEVVKCLDRDLDFNFDIYTLEEWFDNQKLKVLI